jgi:tripartite ATP-independent transporter DctM subunit
MTGARVLSIGRTVEQAISAAALALMAAIPVAALIGREFFGQTVTGSKPFVEHLVFSVTFLGAALAAGSGQLIAMATPSLLPGRFAGTARIFTSGLGAAISAAIAYTSLEVLRIDYLEFAESGATVAWGIPVWAFVALMPAALLAIALRLVWTAADRWRGRGAAFAVALAVVTIVTLPDLDPQTVLWPALGVLAAATAMGLPIFAALGGAGMLLFWSDGFPVSSVPQNAYDLTNTDLLPALPLFALAGYFLSEGGAGKRLMRAFDALFGWLPGGLAIVVTIVLAFFTTLGSGVTILSLGGLILPAMVKAGYSEKSSIGLVTVGGSTGLLFPPSLPVILYGIRAGTPIDQLFIGGLLPGLLLVAVVAGWGAFQGRRAQTRTQKFVPREVIPALWGAKWDLLTPVIVLAGFFGGFATLVEAAALTVFYALFVECVVHRELRVTRDAVRIAVECSAMVGGFLILLGVALGFMNYLTLEDVPAKILELAQAHISSRAAFLLVLNLFLIVVGAVTDIFSAILVIVPLLTPLARHYGIEPVHLGVVFLTNMELGYLMPPMGENLFLSSIRFKQKLSWIYASTIPYLALIVAVVLLVTYAPELTLAPVRWLR